MVYSISSTPTKDFIGGREYFEKHDVLKDYLHEWRDEFASYLVTPPVVKNPVLQGTVTWNPVDSQSETQNSGIKFQMEAECQAEKLSCYEEITKCFKKTWKWCRSEFTYYTLKSGRKDCSIEDPILKKVGKFVDSIINLLRYVSLLMQTLMKI